ncbi:hypothetical protein [Streptomyces spinoverrucosus]|uniref:hypothetical protein n=1 Tax=Streptomyces spinoverrucosus TaxID=284043 RepID=UPI001E4D27D0|nr:hypothetical protein [Streptomyces spinoverrucosus]
MGQPRRILLTGRFSFRDGEVTAGDVPALRRVEDVLERAGPAYDVAWSAPPSSFPGWSWRCGRALRHWPSTRSRAARR